MANTRSPVNEVIIYRRSATGSHVFILVHDGCWISWFQWRPQGYLTWRKYYNNLKGEES